MMLDTHQVAVRLGVDVETVRRWIRSSKLLATNVGSPEQPTWRVDEKDMEAFRAARTNAAGSLSPSEV